MNTKHFKGAPSDLVAHALALARGLYDRHCAAESGHATLLSWLFRPLLLALVGTLAGAIVAQGCSGSTQSGPPALTDQRAYLLSACPRSGGFKPALTLLGPPPTERANEALGSGLTVLADWLDAPQETGAVRKSWQVSGKLAEDGRLAGCLVLIAGDFCLHRPDTCATESASADGPPATPTTIGCSSQCCDQFLLHKQPDIYAEVAIEATADHRAIRLSPRRLEFGSGYKSRSSAPLNLSFYATLAVNGRNLGVTAFRLPSKPPESTPLSSVALEGHSGPWLLLPPREPNQQRTGDLAWVLAVLHQSPRDPDVDAHLLRILALAENARASSLLVIPPTTTGPLPANGRPAPSTAEMEATATLGRAER